jgi:hypothetical protein
VVQNGEAEALGLKGIKGGEKRREAGRGAVNSGGGAHLL